MQKFELKAPVLTEGRGTTEMPATQRMRASLKYLHEGGEVNLHSHTHEDQTYLVLDGEVVFYDANGMATNVSRGEGMLMPKGEFYRFHQVNGPAVVLRIGGTSAEDWDHYLDANGNPFSFGAGSPGASDGGDGYWTLDGVVQEQPA